MKNLNAKGFSIVEALIAMAGLGLASMVILQMLLNDAKQKKQLEEKNALLSISSTLVKEGALDSCLSILTRAQAMLSTYVVDTVAKTITPALSYSDSYQLTSSGANPPNIPTLNSSGADISTSFPNVFLRLYPMQQYVNGQALSYFTVQYAKAASGPWNIVPGLETYKAQIKIFAAGICD